MTKRIEEASDRITQQFRSVDVLQDLKCEVLEQVGWALLALSRCHTTNFLASSGSDRKKAQILELVRYAGANTPYESAENSAINWALNP